MNVLIIEDEPAVASFIQRGLEDIGHQVVVAHDGSSGLLCFEKSDIHIVIMDIILPDINGLDVCREIRQRHGYGIPIIMLTALSDTEDVVKGLREGADDYIAKPFKFKELVARLESLSRRANIIPVNTVIRIDDLELNQHTRLVSRAGKNIRLTAREFELLSYLMQHANHVLSRESILAGVWEMDWDVETNIVDVYINYLRNKIDKPYERKLIKTIVGMGYIITMEDIS